MRTTIRAGDKDALVPTRVREEGVSLSLPNPVINHKRTFHVIVDLLATTVSINLKHIYRVDK